MNLRATRARRILTPLGVTPAAAAQAGTTLLSSGSRVAAVNSVMRSAEQLVGECVTAGRAYTLFTHEDGKFAHELVVSANAFGSAKCFCFLPELFFRGYYAMPSKKYRQN